MEALLNVAKDKLKMLHNPHNEGQAILPWLMLTVWNQDSEDNLGLNMYDRNDMEMEISSLLYCSDTTVWKWLGLDNQERAEEISTKLSKAKTEKQIRDVLIMDLLYEWMSEMIEGFPNQLKISSAEPNNGEAFL